MTVAIIARQQLRLLARSGTFLLMLVILLVMTALSGFIGWSSHATIIRVYDETVRTLHAAGKPAPPNPFEAKPRLALLNNMIIYVPLIGALLAIVIGHRAVTDDRQAGVVGIVLSRPLQRSCYLAGKITACTVALAVIMTACLVLSIVAVTLINSSAPTAAELARLVGFYGLSTLYLVVFALVGIVAALLTGSHATALFGAVAVWVLITFATPQFTSGLRPVASLNPITDPASISTSGFFQATSQAKPFAVDEQYKSLSTRILSAGSSVEPGTATAAVAPIVGLIVLLCGIAIRHAARHDLAAAAARD